MSSGGDPRFFNRYAYCYNDPINCTDPTGKNGIGLTDTDRALIRAHSPNRPPTGAELRQMGGMIADFTPVVGDIKGIGEAIANPTKANIAAAAVGLIPGAGDIAGKGIKAGANAKSAASGVGLQKQLVSESQVADLASGGGTVISQPAKQANRIAAETGANAGDIQKVSSDSFVAKDGQQIQTHSFRDASNNTLIEPKTIIDENR